MRQPAHKIINTAIRGYNFETKLYRRLVPHRKIKGGCATGKLYPLPSNPTEYAVCLKCGRHVSAAIQKHYGVTIPQNVPNLKELRITW